MRTFGTDSPEFMTFKLGDSEKVYKIPLAASMPLTELLAIDKAEKEGNGLEAELEFLRKHIGDAVDSLTAGDVSAIILEWNAQSGAQGAEPGES